MEPPPAGAARRRPVNARRRGRLPTLALCGVALLVACSGSDSTATTAATAGTPPATEPPPTEPPATEPVAPASAVPDESTVDSANGAGSTTEPPTIQLSGPAVIDDSGAAGVTPSGFTTATVRITEADGTTCEVCMWLADEASERSRGLMGVTDLGEAAGMAFVFEAPIDGAFYMFQTVTPLSIAWFGADGAVVSTTDMEPCADALPDACQRYPAGAEFQLAIEVFQGGLADLGIGAGSRAEVVAGTEAPTCPLVDR